MKKPFLYSIILLPFFICNFIQAQQWKYFNPTSWFDVNAIEIPGPGVIVIGGGSETPDSIQVMFRSANYGITWVENSHDGFAPWNKSIAFSDALNGYGVGYDGRIIKSDDGGMNWGWPVTPVGRDLNKIVYAGSGTYYIAGGNKRNYSIQTILKSTNFGANWNVIYDTPGPWLKSILFMDTMKGFAVGENGVILSTTNGGITWATISTSVQRDFNAVTFISADTGYIIGGTQSGTYRKTILRTVNGGSTWSVILDSPGGILKDISFADSLLGYIVGDSATVLKTTDGGLSWFPVVIDSNLTGNESFNVVKFYDKNFGVIGGKAGVLYIYQNLPVDVYSLSVDQVGTNDAYLVGGINTHTKIARNSFVYSDNILFSSAITTTEEIVQNDSVQIISKYIQGLAPNTEYFYFCKAITVSDTIYGDTLSFFTGNSSSVFQTLDATNVSLYAADLNALVNNIEEHVDLFFEYGVTPAFGSRIAATPFIINDTNLYNITCSIHSLLPNAVYFFRLIGDADSGTFYGYTKNFTTGILPTVQTGGASSITSYTARLNGTVIPNGLPATLKFQYGLTNSYGTEVLSVPDSIPGSGGLSSYCIISGLTPSATYHYRMKATNINGTGYGVDKIFTTGNSPAVTTLPASSVTNGSANLNAVVVANDNQTAIKFEWGYTTVYGHDAIANPDSAFGTLNTYASFYLDSLNPDTTYHYRAKAITNGNIVFGNDETFYTLGLPIVTTLPASSITVNSAQLNAIVIANNNQTAIKFEWGLTNAYGNEVAANPDSASGALSTNASFMLSGLNPNITYHFRVKALVPGNTIYGNDVSFFTASMPTLSTLPASSVTYNSAQLNATVNANNSPAAIKFEWGTTTAYGNEVTAIPDSASGSSVTTATYLFSGLYPNTSYHIRVKAITSGYTVYGNDEAFTTLQTPIVMTLPASSISLYSAQINAVVNANNNPVAIKFDWGLTTSYGNEAIPFPDSAFGSVNTNAAFVISGLNPGTIYHYRVKAITSGNTLYSNDLSFFTAGIPTLTTLPASLISLNSAQLNANVNANNTPAAITFEWGLTPFYGNEVNAVPDSAYGTGNSSSTYSLSGLIQNTTYHYRVKAMYSSGTVYGNDMVFLTRNVLPDALTQMASQITLNSAKLNAIVNPHENATTIKFDYGLSSSYGSEINAYPASSSGSSDLNVYADLSNLSSNTLYHFRIKLITLMDTVFGNDMIFFTGNSEVPNFDFEKWTPTTIAKLKNWDITVGKISQYIPACYNNYSAKIENYTYKSTKHLQPGLILLGSTNDAVHFTGGIPFNAHPDTLIGCFNYFIPDNDTALILIILKKQGVVISDKWYKIHGTSSGNFDEMKFPISYSSGVNADSMIIAFVVTDIRLQNEQFPSGGYLIIDHIRFTGTTENIPNYDFEDWDTNTFYSLDHWYSRHNDPIHPDNRNFSRTTDAQHGNYAVKIQNYLNDSDTLTGWFSTSLQWSVPGFSVNARHQSLTGYYKFLPENNDTMNIRVNMFKNHYPVGSGTFMSNNAVNSYSPFIVDIQYYNSDIPDSATICFQSSFLSPPTGNSVLYVDNLNFDGFFTGIKEPALTSADSISFNVFPNPLSEKGIVSFETHREENVTVRLFDLSGKQIALLAGGIYKPGLHKINFTASGLSKGFYICMINTNYSNYFKKIIIQ